MGDPNQDYANFKDAVKAALQRKYITEMKQII